MIIPSVISYVESNDLCFFFTEYLKSSQNITITKSEFVNVINHKIGDWKSKSKLTKEEMIQKAEDKRLQARINRQKRKLTIQEIYPKKRRGK